MQRIHHVVDDAGAFVDEEAPLPGGAAVGGLEDAALVDLLLTRGAQVDSRDLRYGQTPLMLAVREAHNMLKATR